MPDPITGVEDIVTDGPVSEAESTATATGDRAEETYRFAGCDYASQEEAEKAHKEMQARATRAEQEQAQQAKDNAMAEAMTKISEVAEGMNAPKVDKEANRAQILESFAQRLEDGDPKEYVNIMAEFTGSLEQDMRAESQEQMKAVLDKMAELEGNVTTFRTESSDEYKAHRTQIETLENAGLSREQALIAVKNLDIPAETAPAMPAPAGTSGGNAAISQDRDGGMSAEEKAVFAMMATEEGKQALAEGKVK